MFFFHDKLYKDLFFFTFKTVHFIVFYCKIALNVRLDLCQFIVRKLSVDN